MVARYDHLYVDENFARFSTRRIDSSYRTFSENLAEKWPGYALARSGHIFNKTDRVVRLDNLL